MRRVCWIFEFPTINGGENSLLACADEIAAAGFEIGALCPAGGALSEELARRGVEVVDFQVRNPTTGAKFPQQQLRDQLSNRLTAMQADLVHANSLAMGRLVGPVTESLGIPAIGHLRDIVKLSATAVCDLNRLDRILAVSAATRDTHLRQGLDAKRSYVQFNGIDLDLFRPAPQTGWLHEELELPADAQLVGAIGQLVIRKGHEVFLQAAARIAEQCPRAHFLVIGDCYSGKEEALAHWRGLQQAVAEPPLVDRASLLGHRDDVREVLTELSLLVHTARQEPLGRVLLEAAACGVPVVATEVGGTSEIFPPETESAVLVSADDAQVVALEMRRLLEDDQARLRLGENARRRAEAAFDIRQAGPALVKHYLSVAEGGSR